MSETDKCRERLSKYCIGDGLDIGFGGSPIVSSAITLDLPTPYTKVGDHPQNLHGDARNLYWFKNECLDYIFSSHLIEDFTIDEIGSLLWEWWRVLKFEGHLVLYLPDEQVYRKHCKDKGTSPNANHKNDNFSLEFLKNIIEIGPSVMKYGSFDVIHEQAHCDDYCFEIVLQKKK